MIQNKKSEFMLVYNKTHRLASAVFMVANIIEDNIDLKNKLKGLSLNIVSYSVKLKDSNFSDTKKIILDIEKNALELMSVLDIAAVSGLISKMNGSILRESFQNFIKQLSDLVDNFENNNIDSVENIFDSKKENLFDSKYINMYNQKSVLDKNTKILDNKNVNNVIEKNNPIISKNDHDKKENNKRKEQRREAVLSFIKDNNGCGIKDILPNIVGCSEKTVQRELISLINEGKLRKIGERRWSKYFVV